MDIINPYIHGGEALTFDGFGNRSRSFDGVDDYVELADPTNTIGTNYSFTAWANFGDFTANGHTIFSIADSVSSYLSVLGRIVYDQNLNTLHFHIRSSSSNQNIVSLPNFNASAYATGWHHYAFVRTGDKVEGFIDGVSVGSDSSSAINTTVSSHYFDIGTLRNGFNSTTRNGNFFMTGGISDFRHYDASLTASQISDIYNGTNITTNLVGHWLTDADNVLDAAGSNNGTNYGTKYSYDNPSPPVEFGRASRSFDGSGNYVDLGNNYGSSVFTASAWIKRDTIATQAVGVVGKWKTTNDKSWLIFSGNEHKFIIRQSNDVAITCTDPTSAVINQWYNLVATADGSNLKLYVDGSLVDTQSYDGTISTNSLSTDIGTFRQSDGNFFFDGKIADVRIYDTDLTASQVSDIYSGTDVQTNLIGHWLTDNDDVEDKAGTNDGTNFGSVYSYEAPLPANKLIDTYASTCGAYSLRELSTTWASQSVVDVRRVSDDTVQSFTEAQISDGTLATFCGTQGGFVSKIYDQSGNGFDLMQPTSGFQPRIYTGATQSVVTDNGKPALEFSGAYMYNAGSFDYEGGVSWVCVLNTDNVGNDATRIWCDDITGTQGYVYFTATSYYLNDGAGYANFPVVGQTTNQQIRSFYFNEATGNYVYGMNETETSGSLGGFTQGTIEISGTSANIGVMGAGNGSQTLSGLWQELIVYPNNQRHNKENIERNVNEFYSIY